MTIGFLRIQISRSIALQTSMNAPLIPTCAETTLCVWTNLALTNACVILDSKAWMEQTSAAQVIVPTFFQDGELDMRGWLFFSQIFLFFCLRMVERRMKNTIL